MVSRADGLFPSPEFDENFSNRMSQNEYDTWFQDVEFEFDAPNLVTLTVATPFHQDWIESQYANLLLESIEEVFDFQPSLRFVCPTEAENEDRGTGDTPVASEHPTKDTSGSGGLPAIHGASGAVPGANVGSIDLGEPESAVVRDRATGSVTLCSPTSPVLTFETFVEGPSNRVAYAAARSVSESRDESSGTSTPPKQNPYNPLLIYGASGLGKTHLLQSCYHEFGRGGGRQALYITGESFLNLCKEVASDAVASPSSHKSTASVRQTLSSFHALIVDGVHLLARDVHFQDALCAVLDDFCADDKPVVLSLDVPPWEVPGLKDRLASRMKTGLVARLDPLPFEHKVELLQNKAAQAGLTLVAGVAETLARGLGDNPCLVEGLVRQLVSMYGLQDRGSGVAGDLDSAIGMATEGCLQTQPPGGSTTPGITSVSGPPYTILKRAGGLPTSQLPSRRLEMCDIHRVVATYYSVRRADIVSSSRKNALVRARQVAMYLTRVLTQHSFGEIGSYFGGRDHATVIHAVKKIGRLTESDQVVTQDLKNISRALECI